MQFTLSPNLSWMSETRVIGAGHRTIVVADTGGDGKMADEVTATKGEK